MIKKWPNNDYFKTSDLALCATLCFFGYQIEAINKANKSKVIFYIKIDSKLDNTIQKFWKHQLEVEPLAFFNLIKEVKNRLYSN